MLSWKNVREGDAYLRVSTDGRFVIRRKAVNKPAMLLRFSYELQDTGAGRTEELPTLQAARKLAMAWAGG